MTAPVYSVVIPAFNEEALLPRTLAALERAMASVPYPGEVVVCDNNSTDATAAIARAAGAEVVFEPVNQISRARNRGARSARGRFLVFVDADTEVPPEILREAIERLASGRVAGGGATVRTDVASSPLVERMVAAWNAVSRSLCLAAGSFVFVRSDAFASVGGFSEKVYASEEIWLSCAVRRWGRARGMKFVILDAHPVVTSNRKAEWYATPVFVAATAVFLVFFPFMVRSRALCWFWYRRPPR